MNPKERQTTANVGDLRAAVETLDGWNSGTIARDCVRRSEVLALIDAHDKDLARHDEAALAEALRANGWEPPDNVCASCGHSGGDHDLGNWCLICPRPDNWDRTAKSPTGAKTDAGWCFFGSMTEAERWEHGLARLRGGAES